MTTRMGRAMLVAAPVALLLGGAIGWRGRDDGWQARTTPPGQGWFASAMEWLDRPLVG